MVSEVFFDGGGGGYDHDGVVRGVWQVLLMIWRGATKERVVASVGGQMDGCYVSCWEGISAGGVVGGRGSKGYRVAVGYV